jgi:hypothetical protein
MKTKDRSLVRDIPYLEKNGVGFYPCLIKYHVMKTYLVLIGRME